MKLLVASILAMSVVACVAPPDPQPEPEAAPPSEANAAAEADSNATAAHDSNAADPFRVVFFCRNNPEGSCFTFPATFPNAHADCVRFCQLDGVANPDCRITLRENIEC